LHAFFHVSPADKEYDRRLKASLEDEHLYDPDTGTKISLEEAESGEWVVDYRKNNIVPDEELELSPNEVQVQIDIAKNHLKKGPYELIYFSERQEDVLEMSQMLDRYDYWEYSEVFKALESETVAFVPTVREYGGGGTHIHRAETQLLFWMQVPVEYGHYYFRELTLGEKVVSAFRVSDRLSFPRYKTFEITAAADVEPIAQLLSCLTGEKKLEFEVIANNLLIKTRRVVCIEDVLRLEELVKTIEQRFSH
jgi:hypothetical protein